MGYGGSGFIQTALVAGEPLRTPGDHRTNSRESVSYDSLCDTYVTMPGLILCGSLCDTYVTMPGLILCGFV